MAKTIQITDFLSTGFYQEFSSVKNVTVSNTPFGGGGFGEVFVCESIDGKKPSTDQVIKILFDPVPGMSAQNLDTIRNLQHELHAYSDQMLQKTGKSLIESHQAFLGAPQFSFVGKLGGKEVRGYSTNNLKSLGFFEFTELLNPSSSHVQQYQSTPLEYKILLAYRFVHAFKVLKDLSFIHADIKPECLFISMNTWECALIDFDSGSVTSNINDVVTTYGTQGMTLAPEISVKLDPKKNINGRVKVTVNLLSDMWSISTMIHLILTTAGPYFFLKEASPRAIKEFLLPGNQPWPTINKGSNYFDSINLHHYNAYLNWFNNVLPSKIRSRFVAVFNSGYNNPSRRVSYDMWERDLHTVLSSYGLNVSKPITIVIPGQQKSRQLGQNKAQTQGQQRGQRKAPQKGTKLGPNRGKQQGQGTTIGPSTGTINPQSPPLHKQLIKFVSNSLNALPNTIQVPTPYLLGLTGAVAVISVLWIAWPEQTDPPPPITVVHNEPLPPSPIEVSTLINEFITNLDSYKSDRLKTEILSLFKNNQAIVEEYFPSGLLYKSSQIEEFLENYKVLQHEVIVLGIETDRDKLTKLKVETFISKSTNSQATLDTSTKLNEETAFSQTISQTVPQFNLAVYNKVKFDTLKAELENGFMSILDPNIQLNHVQKIEAEIIKMFRSEQSKVYIKSDSLGVRQFLGRIRLLKKKTVDVTGIEISGDRIERIKVTVK